MMRLRQYNRHPIILMLIKISFLSIIFMMNEYSTSSAFHFMLLTFPPKQQQHQTKQQQQQQQHQQHQSLLSFNTNYNCYNKHFNILCHHHQLDHDDDSSLPFTTETIIQETMTTTTTTTTRRELIMTSIFMTSIMNHPIRSLAIVEATTMGILENESSSSQVQQQPVSTVVSGDSKKLYNEGNIYERQGNMMAAQRLYKKVTQISPQYIYGYSSLGNTQTALGELNDADISYTNAIQLCNVLQKQQNDNNNNNEQQQLKRSNSCQDLYLIYLNRGCVRLNNNQKKLALNDLQLSNTLRARPDAFILQNLARAYELNGDYINADDNYNVAISMTSNEVNPFWLRSAIVKYQLNDIKNGYDIFKRIENRFPEAPEVRAVSAIYLYNKGDMTAAQQKFLEIPDKARLKYSDNNYLNDIISWPPKMIQTLSIITKAVGDTNRAR